MTIRLTRHSFLWSGASKFRHPGDCKFCRPSVREILRSHHHRGDLRHLDSGAICRDPTLGSDGHEILKSSQDRTTHYFRRRKFSQCLVTNDSQHSKGIVSGIRLHTFMQDVWLLTCQREISWSHLFAAWWKFSITALIRIAWNTNPWQ